MSTGDNFEFDDWLKSNTDGFKIKPRSFIYNQVSAKVIRYQKIKRIASYSALMMVVASLLTLGYFEHSNKIVAESKEIKPKPAEQAFFAPLLPQPKQIPVFNAQPLKRSNKTELYTFVNANPYLGKETFNVATDNSKQVTQEQAILLGTKSATIAESAVMPPSSALKRPLFFGNKQSSWTLSAFVSAGFSYRKLNYIESYGNLLSGYSNRNGFEWDQHEPIIGVVAGVSAAKHINKKYYIKTGLQVYMGGYNIENKLQYLVEPPNTIGSKTVAVEPVKSAYRVVFAETPILIGHQWHKSAYTLSLDGGVIISARLYEKTPQAAGLLGREDAVWNGRTKLLNTSLQITPAVTYHFYGKELQTGLDLRYQISSTYQRQYPVKEHLFFVGIKTGITL